MEMTNRKPLESLLGIDPILGLQHPLPQVRTQSAIKLGEFGNQEDLIPLKRISLNEMNLLCKIEMVRAIVALETRFGLNPHSAKSLDPVDVPA